MKGCSLSRKYPHLSFPLSEALEEELLGHQPPPLLHGALLRGEPNHIYYQMYKAEQKGNILLTFNKLQLACHDRLFLPPDGDRPRSFPESCGRQPAISCYVVCGIKLRCFPSPRNARMHAICNKKGSLGVIFFSLTRLNENYYFLDMKFNQ